MELQAEIRGRDLVTGEPRSAIITSEEVRETLAGPSNGRWSLVDEASQLRLESVGIEFEFDDNTYVLPESQATLLGENLRNFAAGTFPKDVQNVIEQGGAAPDWTDGALPLANVIEDTLIEARDGPIPLEGKAASAAFAALALIVHVGDPPDDPPGADALLTALRGHVER